MDPIFTKYGDLEVWEIPPTGRALGLMALNILRGLTSPEDKHAARTYHLQNAKLALPMPRNMWLMPSICRLPFLPAL